MELRGENLKQIAEAWQREWVLVGNSPKTIKNKKESLHRLLSWLGDRELNLPTAKEYLLHLKEERKYKQNSLSAEIVFIACFSKWLYQEEYIPKQWNDKLPKVKYEKRSDDCYVDPSVIREAILKGTEPKPFIRRGEPGDHALNKKRKLETRDALLFTLAHGLRINETLRLQGTDFNMHDTPQPTFWIAPSKGSKRTRFPLSLDVVEMIKSRLQKEKVFETTAKLCNASLQRGCEALGLSKEITNHVLRHIYLSNLVKQKTPLPIVQRLARHSDISITIKNYTHLDISELASAQTLANPVARATLTFTEKMQFVEDMLKMLHLEQSGVQVELTKNETEMNLRFTPQDAIIASPV